MSLCKSYKLRSGRSEANRKCNPCILSAIQLNTEDDNTETVEPSARFFFHSPHLSLSLVFSYFHIVNVSLVVGSTKWLIKSKQLCVCVVQYSDPLCAFNDKVCTRLDRFFLILSLSPFTSSSLLFSGVNCPIFCWKQNTTTTTTNSMYTYTQSTYTPIRMQIV